MEISVQPGNDIALIVRTGRGIGILAVNAFGLDCRAHTKVHFSRYKPRPFGAGDKYLLIDF